MPLKYLKTCILYIFLPALASAQGANITVTGKINPAHNGEKVTMIYGTSMRKITIDTTRVKDGTITFRLVNVEPQIVNITMGKKVPTDHISVFVSKNDITLSTNDSLKQAVVTGDKLSEDYSRMNAPIAKLQQQQYGYMAKLSAIPATERESEAALAITAIMQDNKLRQSEATYAAIDANPNSYIALLFLKNVTGGTVKYDVAFPHFSKLNAQLRTSAEGKLFEEKMLAVKNLRSGLIAADFESTTPDGKKLKLYDIIPTAKYTLIDFWASWCVPCRAENPNVVKAYNGYHSKGLNIISVSLDTKGENWKAAILKDGMPWLHVSGLIGFKEPAAELYGIKVIPQNVLVDSKGTIVATNLRGPELSQKLKELLN